jgi:tetratricopeptide (TPR) repeat protein
LKLHRLDEAAATFTQAISLNGRFAFPRLNLGVVRNRQGQSAEAVKILSQLLKEQPGLTQARLPLAEALRATQQWTAAEQQLREALKDARLERALQAEAHEQLGVLLNRAEQYVAAAGELEQAAALNPESASAQLYLGAAWLQLQKLTEAERALLRAYELAGPRVGTAQLLLGQLYYQQRKFDLAQRAFEQYLKDVPAAPNAAQIKEVLGKLKELLKQ